MGFMIEVARVRLGTLDLFLCYGRDYDQKEQGSKKFLKCIKDGYSKGLAVSLAYNRSPKVRDWCDTVSYPTGGRARFRG